MQEYVPDRVHVVVGSPWRDAVFALLGAPLRPWSVDGEVHRGDGVLVVIDSDPQLVLTDVVVVGADGDVHVSITEETRGRFHVPTASVADIEADVGWALGGVIVGTRVGELMAVMDEHGWKDGAAAGFGQTTLAAARTLLTSGGYCTGCGVTFPVRTAAGRDSVSVWAVEGSSGPRHSPDDWPAALCAECRNRVAEGGFTRFLDYRFARHPRCPRCGGQRTMAASFGMPIFPAQEPPWVDQRGCVVTPDEWTCSLCEHYW
ncbi:hypothetical protein ACWDUN_00835 [Mycobacterium sp. NPDC003323]